MNAGWNEYKDIKETLKGLIEKGYTASMIQQVLEENFIDDIGEVSDGYHTFNQLYHQRAVLFATIVNLFPDKSWKTWKHEDGNYCFDKGGEWFLVSVETPEGVYGYHYQKEYWNMFNCQEIEKAKHWDGYTEEDVTRLLSLKEDTAEWIYRGKFTVCSRCGEKIPYGIHNHYCRNCGAKMKEREESK